MPTVRPGSAPVNVARNAVSMPAMPVSTANPASASAFQVGGAQPFLVCELGVGVDEADRAERLVAAGGDGGEHVGIGERHGAEAMPGVPSASIAVPEVRCPGMPGASRGVDDAQAARVTTTPSSS